MGVLRVIGHRANSLRILLLYKLQGVEYVEVDVSPGNGGEPLVLHGPSEVRRATPIGRVFAYIDYKLFYRDPIMRPSSLEEWLERLDWVKGVLLDVKSEVDMDMLLDAVENAGFAGATEYSSSDHVYLKLLGSRGGARTFPSIGERLVDTAGYVYRQGFTGASLKYTVINKMLVDEMHSLGLTVYAWTVNNPQTAARLASMGVDGVISDTPSSILSR